MDDVEVVVVNRVAGRVILLDPEGRALLFQGFDPQRPETSQWFTPGGGVEPGESIRDAAARELQEETGLAVKPEDLGEEVFRDYAEFIFDGKLLRQHNHFFACEPRPSRYRLPASTRWSGTRMSPTGGGVQRIYAVLTRRTSRRGRPTSSAGSRR